LAPVGQTRLNQTEPLGYGWRERKKLQRLEELAVPAQILVNFL